jgi:sugar/nucleoside kinase (ribokinase family)
VIDTTGAGDAFVGGFLVEWLLSSRSLVRSLRSGCILGASVVSLLGGSATPSAELLRYTSSLPSSSSVKHSNLNNVTTA